MALTDTDTFDNEMMVLALQEAKKCEPKVTAFSVGCVLVTRLANRTPVVLERSYSRELPGNTHAEANAMEKARRLDDKALNEILRIDVGLMPSIDDILRQTDVYTTMEPCSTRTSGLAPCADALIKAAIPRCVIGVGEPADFVVCDGARKLVEVGTQVIWLKGMEEECLRIARKGHDEL